MFMQMITSLLLMKIINVLSPIIFCNPFSVLYQSAVALNLFNLKVNSWRGCIRYPHYRRDAHTRIEDVL